MVEQQVVVITGAASGIGEATARVFAREGAKVVLLDEQRERLRELCDQLGDTCAEYVVDIRDDGAVRVAVADAVLRFGGFDVICQNAGIGFPEAPLTETTEEAVRAMLDVNLLGAVHVLRAAIPAVRDGGVIILTSSTSGQQGHPGAAVYAATKIGLIGLGRSLALELAPRRIRVNMVCPGGVDTPMLEKVYGGGSTAAMLDYEHQNLLGRIAAPTDVANAIHFLASPEARHINGVSLRVDGGDCVLGAI